MGKIEEYKEFEAIFSKYISEIEVFIPNLNEKAGKQQVLSMVKRFSYLNSEASKLDFDFVVNTTSIIIEFLAKGKDIGEEFHALGHIIIDTLKLGVALTISAFEDMPVPEDFEDMLQDALKSILIQHSENVHPDQFYKQWVLVVDDENIIRTYVEDILFNEGYLVLGASNGLEAKTVVSTGYFDIVFTDINMPFMSGLELLEFIRAGNISVDVIVVTGYASVKSASQAIHHGAYDYITKPFNGPDEVLNAAERAMQHRLLIKKNETLMKEMQESNLKLSRYAVGLEDALKSLEEKDNALIKAERMATLGVLVAGLAHEINNPTTFIRGNIQTLKKFWGIIQQKIGAEDTDIDKGRLEYILNETPILLNDMMIGTDRIAKITGGLRVFARVDGASDKMDKCSVQDIVDGAVSVVTNRLNNGVILDKEIDEVAPVVASVQQMIQVVVNLLINALDAVDSQSIKLISIKVYESGDDVCIEVMDNGEGIPKNIQDKIFDPFFTTKPVDKGTGLGLSLSEGIVSVHGGALRLVSSGSDGTAFEISLPKVISKEKTTALPKVLFFVEQSAVFRSFETGIKAAKCCELIVVEPADNEPEFIAKLEEVRPKVVVVDMKLSRGNGGMLINRLINEVDHSIKILGVGDGRIDNFTDDEMQQMKFDRVILLPCNLRKVLVTLEELL